MNTSGSTLGVEQIRKALEACTPEREQGIIRSKALIREDTFEGRRAGEKHWFTKQRQKNRSKNKAARKARKR